MYKNKKVVSLNSIKGRPTKPNLLYGACSALQGIVRMFAHLSRNLLAKVGIG